MWKTTDEICKNHEKKNRGALGLSEEINLLNEAAKQLAKLGVPLCFPIDSRDNIQSKI